MRCALGWACWKTYVGRPETDLRLRLAIGVLGAGLSDARHNEDAVSVWEADLSMRRRLGDDEENMLAAQNNLAFTYSQLRRDEEALSMRQDIYSRRLELNGEEHVLALGAAMNYSSSLISLKRFEDAKSLLSKATRVARRVLGEDHIRTLELRWNCAVALYDDPAASLDDLRKAVSTLEDTERIARRVLGGAHPDTVGIAHALRNARAVLRAHETQPSASA